MTVDIELLRRLPKVSLHDHLDGGLRPQTIIELAAEIDYPLPAETADDLGRWFLEAADSGSLVRYLETFDHTIAVMQTAANLRRVAREFVEDLAADGVVYGEARWAPEQHTTGGLSMAAAVEAVRDGLAEGMEACRAAGREIVVRQLVTSMRYRRADDRGRRAGAALPPRRRRRVRHRRRRGRVPAGAVPDVVPAAAAAQARTTRSTPARPTAWSRSGRRPALRGEPDRARRRDRRGHRNRRRRPARCSGTWPLRPRPADPARDVPVVQRADRRGGLDCRASDHAAGRARLPGHRQLRQPADERHPAFPRVLAAVRGARLRPRRRAPAHPQRSARARSCRTTSVRP